MLIYAIFLIKTNSCWEEFRKFDLSQAHGQHECQQVKNDTEKEYIWHVFAVLNENLSGLFALSKKRLLD